MAIRKQQEIKLQAAIHGIPMENKEISHPVESPTSDSDFKNQLAERIAKGLPVKVIVRGK